MRSLRTNLIVYFLLLIGLPLLLVVWRFSSTFHSETDKFVRQHTSNILIQTEKNIGSLIAKAQKITDYNNDIFKKRTLPLPSKEMISKATFVHYSVRELLKTSIFNADMIRNVGVDKDIFD